MKLLESSTGGQKNKTIEGKENIDALKQNIMAEVDLLLSTKLAEATKTSEEQMDRRLEVALEKKLKPVETKLQETIAENNRLKQREEELNTKVDALVQSVSSIASSVADISKDKLGTVRSRRKAHLCSLESGTAQTRDQGLDHDAREPDVQRLGDPGEEAR